MSDYLKPRTPPDAAAMTLASTRARHTIFTKLQKVNAPALSEPDTASYYQNYTPQWSSPIERLQHWADTMRQFKTEIYWVNEDNWTEVLSQIIQEKNLRSLVLSSRTAHGQAAQHALQKSAIDCTLYDFNKPLDEWKEQLFAEVDAGFTGVTAGIAKTGTLVLIPDTAEPRTMSLVPPVHIALFDTETMQNDFFTAMQALEIAEQTPTNVVLISSPSKTSDIQLTLAFGAHGPRDLVVLAKLPASIRPSDMDQERI